MATTTPHLRLTKPLGTEQYDINVFNNNADLIDAQFQAAGGHDHSGGTGQGPRLGSEALASGAVTAPKLAGDLFEAEQFVNLAPNGGFEFWSAGAAAAPDGWTLRGAGASVAREAATVRHGVYAAALTRAGADCDLGRSLTRDLGGLAYLRGRRFTIGGWVNAAAANRARLELDDGAAAAVSAYHPGGSVWTWLTAAIVVDPAATGLTARCALRQGGATARFDALTVAEGRFAPAFAPWPGDTQLQVSNFQDAAGVDHADRGLWRAECGVTSVAGAVGQHRVDRRITFARAFRTIAAAFAAPDGDVGGKRVLARCANLSTTGFTLHVAQTDVENFRTTAQGRVSWLALGSG